VASTETQHTDVDPTRRRTPAGVFEGLGSLIAIGAIAALAADWFGAHLALFGEPVVIDEEYVRDYWAIVGGLAVGLVATWVGALLRGARVAWGWHALVAVAGLAAALLFAVTSAGPVDDQQPQPPHPAYTGPRCYSGGDSEECPGG
jgi:hypothetical protein